VAYLIGGAVFLIYAFSLVLAGDRQWPIFAVMGVLALIAAWSASRPGPLDRVPVADWLMALIGAASAAYLYIFYQELATRPGAPTLTDLVVAGAGIVMLLEATRRSLGPPLMFIALFFLIYTFAGPYMPDVIAHRGASFQRAMSQQWLSAEGVFGIALGVSTSFVFLFVLFGAMLEKAGRRQLLHPGGVCAARAFARRPGQGRGRGLRHDRADLRLLDRQHGDHRHLHHSADEAGRLFGGKGRCGRGVEFRQRPDHAAGDGGGRLPDGGICRHPYVEVIRHALLPAVISYIALFYIVHLEALKANMEGLPRRHPSTFVQSMIPSA
jgi:TRAP-type uncharacterized transport system fused permease subunit